MEELQRETEIKPIFYLDLKGKTTPLQIRISTRLNELGIPLIPVSPNEFVRLQSGQQSSFLISLCNDINSYKNFLIMRKKFLDLALISGKVSLIDISSFAPIFVPNHNRQNMRYKHIMLPVSLNEMIREVLMWYTDFQKKKQVWPGGTRARLPDGGDNNV